MSPALRSTSGPWELADTINRSHASNEQVRQTKGKGDRRKDRATDQITPPRRPDVWLTMKTKLALLTTEGVDTIGLNVDTADGVVTLHGKVESEAKRTKA